MLTKSQFERWIEALRSGDYPQTQGCMQDDKGFCCLGVLMHIEGEDIVLGEEFDNCNNYNLVYSWVDFPVYSWWDFPEGGHVLSERLISMNDKGHSFQEIADEIVDYYKGKGFSDG